jgi:hypothetical protein
VSQAPSTERLCPSAPAEPGAQLIGVVGAQGQVEHLLTPLVVDASFIDTARRHGGLLGKRFRFASTCQQGGCSHWADHACGLIGRLQDAAQAQAIERRTSLPECGIRKQCRWWMQSGRDACSVCTLVVTDQRAP